MFFLCTRTGSKEWRYVKRALVALAVILAVGLLYQTCANSNSDFVWLSLSFASQTSAALESESSQRKRPIEILSSSSLAGSDSKDNDNSLDFQDLEKQLNTTDYQTTPSSHVAEGKQEDGSFKVKDGSGSTPKQSTAESTFSHSGLEESSTCTNASRIFEKANDPTGRELEIVGENSRNESKGGVSSFNPSYITELVDGNRELLIDRQNRTPSLPVQPKTEAKRLDRDKRGSFVTTAPENITLNRITATEKSNGVSPDSTTGGFDATPRVELSSSPGFDARGSEDGIEPELLVPSSEESRWLLRLERDLYTARKGIGSAPLVNSVDLSAPLYHNISTLKKSYELMEQMFRIYVYQEGTRPLVHVGPTVGIYASEGRFIRCLQRSRVFVVKNPKKAHMFFLPYSVSSMVIKLYVPDSHSMLPLATFIKDYVNLVAAKYPYWNRTQGADHFFVSCHDWGPATARDHQELRQNTVKVVCNADLTEEYVLEKDVSLPEIYLHSVRPPTRLGGPGPGKRPYLAFFAGQMHGRVRPVLLEYWKNKDPDMKIYEVLPPSVAKKTSYIRHMKLSKYCICPMGYEVNSPRIVEAIYYDCVPVIIADNFVLPFSDVLNWDAFSVTVPERDIPYLKDILLGISGKKYRSMQGRLKNVRQHFMWHDVPVKYDVFHMILHSLWMRRLRQVKF